MKKKTKEKIFAVRLGKQQKMLEEMAREISKPSSVTLRAIVKEYYRMKTAGIVTLENLPIS